MSKKLIYTRILSIPGSDSSDNFNLASYIAFIGFASSGYYGAVSIIHFGYAGSATTYQFIYRYPGYNSDQVAIADYGYDSTIENGKLHVSVYNPTKYVKLSVLYCY